MPDIPTNENEKRTIFHEEDEHFVSETKMKIFTALHALILLVTTSAVAAVLRGSVTGHGGLDGVLPRQLQDDGMKDFVPLACNAKIASAKCSSWSDKFGKATSYSARVAIPCGECVTMDLAGGSLALLGGLDVNGKLVFPNKYKLKLSTTMIAVQGELQMTSSKPVNGSPDIIFTMIGDANMTFTPIDVNANKCKGLSTCGVGKKGIVVAGGKVTRK